MRKGKKEAVFINGVLYHSFFNASIETGISNVGVWKAFKKTHGDPAQIKRNFVTTEAWVYGRNADLRLRYGL